MSNTLRRGAADRTVPLSTYRLQLSPHFGFHQAGDLASYLSELGITHAYLSPVFQAGAGSTHGYDIVDPTGVSAELGGSEAFETMAARLRAEGIGLVLDIVPNHMSIAGSRNRWWWDVLAQGRDSPFASWFDIDWDGPGLAGENKVLVPVLGDHYGRVLAQGDLTMAHDPRLGWVVRYFDQSFPLNARSLGEAASDAGGYAPGSRGVEAVGTRSVALADRVNADPDLLDAILEDQHYRLAYWKVASEELDYRRFFDINTMAAVRVEDPEVFDATHSRILSWVSDGTVDGLRIDHVDGLADPAGYLDRLSQACSGLWTVVEKILEGNEILPESWPVAGTTGYGFLNLVGGLFVSETGLKDLTAAYSSITDNLTTFDEAAHQAKHEIMAGPLASDVKRTVALFSRVCAGHRRFRDYSSSELAVVVEEMLACMPVYRIYVSPKGGATRAEVDLMEAAAAEVRHRRGDLDVSPISFLAQVLTGRSNYPSRLTSGADRSRVATQRDTADRAESELRVRFSQVSVSVMAKAVEDTAYYRYHPLVSVNEVGSDPSRPATSVSRFHQVCEAEAAHHPAGMVTTSTHDTKRGEDLRARLALLSEIPEEFSEAARRWMARNQGHRRHQAGPDAATEYLIYQTLVGAWPIGADRLGPYMLKAVREAKVFSSWTEPDPVYEEATGQFVEDILRDEGFLGEVESFVAPLVGPGRVNSLAQTALRLASPGVVDTYQGCEGWNLDLVDPDNRRPVDFGERAKTLSQVAGMTPTQLMARADLAWPKVALTAALLRLRREHPEWLGPYASYQTLMAAGPAADHVVALCRGGAVVVVVPRLVLGLERQGGWLDTAVSLPPGPWRVLLDIARPALIGGREVAVAPMLDPFPVAVLVRDER
ncbi:MAG: malto-oligosyltrehalose synthase [Acidimicrobiales bacterium]